MQRTEQTVLYTLLNSRNQQHNFSSQKLKRILSGIQKVNLATLSVPEAITEIIKNLQAQPEENLPSDLPHFNKFELEWLLQWLLQTFQRHAILIQEFRSQLQSDIHSREDYLPPVSIQESTVAEPLNRAVQVKKGGRLFYIQDED